MMIFLLLAASTAPAATCDAKPFTLKKAPAAQVAQAAPPPKPAPKPKTEARPKPIADCDKPAARKG
jgi:hypothetical protein